MEAAAAHEPHGEASDRPLVVVLTGGPCAGKTTALQEVRRRLDAPGHRVFTVPEAATHLVGNGDGFDRSWADAKVQMQRIMLDFQLAHEEAFRGFAGLPPGGPSLLLQDGCALSGKIYVSDAEWEQVLAFPGRPLLAEEELLQRYDVIIHLVTCAVGSEYQWGPGSNNPVRFHSAEEAREKDERCLRVFGAHPRLHVVPYAPAFGDKLQKVLDIVSGVLRREGR